MAGGLTHHSKANRPKQRRAPIDNGPIAVEPTEQKLSAETEVADLQRMIGNRATVAQLARADNPNLPLHLQHLRQRPLRPSFSAGPARPGLMRRTPAPHRNAHKPSITISRRVRRTIQRNPLQDAIAPYLGQFMQTAKRGGAKLFETINSAGETVKALPGKAKGKVDDYLKEKKRKEKQKEIDKPYKKRKEHTGVKGFFHYAFGSDFTFTPNLSDDLEDLPAEMAALQMQIGSLAQQREALWKIAKGTKGQERKDHEETLSELDKKKQELQQSLALQVKAYGTQQAQALTTMKTLMLSAIPENVKEECKKAGLDPSALTNELEMDSALEIWEGLDPIGYRKTEISARADAFKNVDPAFLPMRNTVEGQLLSDVKKSFIGENLDQERLEREKKEKKAKEKKDRHFAKTQLGLKKTLGYEITEKEQEDANEGTAPYVPLYSKEEQERRDQEQGKPPTPSTGPIIGRNRSKSNTPPRWIPAKPPVKEETIGEKLTGLGQSIGEKVGLVEENKGPVIGGNRVKKDKLKNTEKLTEDSDKASEILGYIGKGTKIGGKPIGMLVDTISGGTQDDEGLLKAIPTVPMLGAEVADMASSIILIKDGNSAQQELGKKKLQENIFAVFNAMGKTVRSALKSAEQFQMSEALEQSGASSALTDLGVPIVGIVTNTAMFVKAAIDAGMNNSNRTGYKKLGKESEGDDQSVALKGSLKHGEVRHGELMASAIGKGVSSGLMVIGDIINLSGVGAIVGESIKTVARVMKVAQKVGETIRDSHRTGKELESRYKAKLGIKGSENEVFERSGKYASTALLRRALEGDPVAIKAVKQHNITAKILDDIRDGKVLFQQARDLIMYDWEEKDDPKTIGMKIKEGLDKVKKGLAKLLEDKEEPQERKEMNIVHYGQQQPMGPFNKPQEKDWENPEIYEPKVKKTKMEKVKETLKSGWETVKGAPKKVGKAIAGLPKKVGDAMGKMHYYDHRLAVTKYKFAKLVKDTLNYGGEKRRGNWVINRVLSKDSDADEQFLLAKELVQNNENWKVSMEMKEAQTMLWQQMLDVMNTEVQLKLKYKIKEKEKDPKEMYKY